MQAYRCLCNIAGYVWDGTLAVSVDHRHVAQLENFRLKVFRAVAEYLNFRKAAGHLVSRMANSHY